jgi:hypothetical protein
MLASLFQQIKVNVAAGKNPLTGIDMVSFEGVASLIATEFSTLHQIWCICDSAIRHYEDEQMESVQDDYDMTNLILSSTAGYWAILSPTGTHLRQYSVDLILMATKPNFNALGFYANEATTIRRELMTIINQLCVHPADILAKSKMPFKALSYESCFSV